MDMIGDSPPPLIPLRGLAATAEAGISVVLDGQADVVFCGCGIHPCPTAHMHDAAEHMSAAILMMAVAFRA
jgi:hypothetical protein